MESIGGRTVDGIWWFARIVRPAVFMPRTVECAMYICCYFRCDSAVVVHLVYTKSKKDVSSLAFFCPTVIISDKHCWLYDDALFSSSHRRDKNILKLEQLIVYR